MPPKEIPAPTLDAESYLVPAQPAEIKFVEQRSRFQATASFAESEEAALDILAAQSRRYHDARHHCWAFRVGQPGSVRERSSDAGEPSGSAGRPILVELQKANLVNAVVVVTRWFGGVKLGVGGLMRAYGESAVLAIATAGVRQIQIRKTLRIECEYSLVGMVEQAVAKSGGSIIEADYGVSAIIKVSLPPNGVDRFSQGLSEGSGGRIVIQSVGR